MVPPVLQTRRGHGDPCRLGRGAGPADPVAAGRHRSTWAAPARPETAQGRPRTVTDRTAAERAQGDRRRISTRTPDRHLLLSGRPRTVRAWRAPARAKRSHHRRAGGRGRRCPSGAGPAVGGRHPSGTPLAHRFAGAHASRRCPAGPGPAGRDHRGPPGAGDGDSAGRDTRGRWAFGSAVVHAPCTAARAHLHADPKSSPGGGDGRQNRSGRAI